MLTSELERSIRIPKDDPEWLVWRQQVVTSTDVSKILGLAPKSYGGKWGTWIEKKTGKKPEFKGNERVDLGSALEEGIARAAAKKMGWTVRHMGEFITIPQLRLGASFDYCIVENQEKYTSPGWLFCSHSTDEEGEALIGGKEDDKAILEVKFLDFRTYADDWSEDGSEIEASIHIEVQCQTEMLVANIPELYIAALVGSELHIIHRTPDEDMQAMILKAVADFWKSIDDDNPPPPDFENEGDAIKNFYNYAEPLKYLDATERPDIIRLVESYRVAHADFKLAETAKKAAVFEILTLVGDHEKVYGQNFTIDCGTTGPSHVPAHDRKGFRRCVPHLKKKKS